MDMNYKIGYIDEDEQQVKKFTRNLRPFGFEVIGYEFAKDMTAEELMEQVYRSEIDLLMIDYKLKESNIVGFNGDVIENLIYNNKPLFPHIIFTSDIDQAEAHVDDWKIIFDKGEVLQDDELQPTKESTKFVQMLRKSIEQYKQYVKIRKDELADLLQLGEAKGLNAAQKSKMLTLQDELKMLDKTLKLEIPKQLLSSDKLENLSKSRIEAEQFLKNLIENKK